MAFIAPQTSAPRNRLLASLPARDLDQLRACLVRVPLVRDQMLGQPGRVADGGPDTIRVPDLVVRERVRQRRSVVLVVDVSGSMKGERVRTAAATVGALAGELARDSLAVVAFWSDAAVLVRMGEQVAPLADLLQQHAGRLRRGHIALDHGVSEDQLRRVNGIGPDSIIRVGQKLRIPSVSGTSARG